MTTISTALMLLILAHSPPTRPTPVQAIAPFVANDVSPSWKSTCELTCVGWPSRCWAILRRESSPMR